MNPAAFVLAIVGGASGATTGFCLSLAIAWAASLVWGGPLAWGFVQGCTFCAAGFGAAGMPVVISRLNAFRKGLRHGP